MGDGVGVKGRGEGKASKGERGIRAYMIERGARERVRCGWGSRPHR